MHQIVNPHYPKTKDVFVSIESMSLFRHLQHQLADGVAQLAQLVGLRGLRERKYGGDDRAQLSTIDQLRELD